MKRTFFASVMVLASVSLVPQRSSAQAQGAGISPEQQTESKVYQMFSGDPDDQKADAQAAEQFLTQNSQTVLKSAILVFLIGTYQYLRDADVALNSAGRLLQIDPDSMQALCISALIKKQQCAKIVDATGTSENLQACDDAVAFAQKGLEVSKPASVWDADWKKEIDSCHPLFHSVLATDEMIAKKDFKAAQVEFILELKLYSNEQSKTVGLYDTLQLAKAYSRPGSAQNLVRAVWFYARAWNFAPASYRSEIESELESYYKTYHSGLDGLDVVKEQARASLFPQ
jgi:hypothetical protein